MFVVSTRKDSGCSMSMLVFFFFFSEVESIKWFMAHHFLTHRKSLSSFTTSEGKPIIRPGSTECLTWTARAFKSSCIPCSLGNLGCWMLVGGATSIGTKEKWSNIMLDHRFGNVVLRCLFMSFPKVCDA